MSKKETKRNEEEKVVTKYDRKMQRRAEEKAKAAKEEKVGKITGIVIVVAVLLFVLSFPIRSWLTVNGTFITVNGEKISRVEFDYYYTITKNGYVSSYGTYMSYLGVDITGDLSTQMYSDDLSFQDFFEEMAVDSIEQNMALKAEAEAAGFTYDVDAEYDELVASLKEYAAESDMTEKEFIQESYGTYATLSRVKQFIKDGLYTSAYYEQLSEEKAATDEEIEAYYEENKDSYDSVDYRMTKVDAELPTEPTDLADTTEEASVSDGDADSTSTDDEEYQPSEAEIELAMKTAEAEANAALKNIETDGDLYENQQRSSVSSKIRDWLFDSERAEGDTTIIEDEDNYAFYVVEFISRYLDQTPTVDMRVVILENEDTVTAEEILAEWQSGDATEDSFAEIADKYNDSDLTTADGGLYEGLVTSSLPDEIAEWLLADERVAGDTTTIAPEDDYVYVIYYIGENDPEWKSDIASTLLNNTLSDYLDELTADMTVEDPKGNLYYLEVQASKEAESADAEASTESTEESASDAESQESAEESASSSAAQ